MPLADTTEELDRSMRSLMIRIAKSALSASVGLAPRDVLSLIESRVLRDESPQGMNVSVRCLRKATTSSGCTDALGPAIACHDDDGKCSVYAVKDLIADPNREVRELVIEYLKRVASSAHSMCSRTRETIHREASAVMSEEGSLWREASIRIVDAVSHDWLLNVAGMRQSEYLSTDDLWSHYLDAVLRPSNDEIGQCMPIDLCPEFCNEAMLRTVHDLTSAATPSSCVDMYVHSLGHLPLGIDLSMSRTLSVAFSAVQRREVIAAVLGAAEASSNPIFKYHACEAALAMSDDLTAVQFKQVAAWFWDAMLPVAKDRETSEPQAGWTVIGKVARYFVHYLETRLPLNHGEAIASMAWWMAFRVMNAMKVSPTELPSFIQFFDEGYGDDAATTWDLLNPPISVSTLRWLTLHGPSPWALSLVASVRNAEQMKRLLDGPGSGSAEERVYAMVSMGMQIASVPLDQSRLRLSTDCRTRVQWAVLGVEQETERVMLELLSDSIDWSSQEPVKNALDGIGVREVWDQLLLCQCVRRRVATSLLTGEEVWRTVSSDLWRKEVWPTLDLKAVQSLCYTLIDDAVRRLPDWLSQVPHLFVEIAEARSSHEADRKVCFSIVLKACCALNAPSALSRLLRGSSERSYLPLAETACVYIERLMPNAGRVGASKLRALHVDLLS